MEKTTLKKIIRAIRELEIKKSMFARCVKQDGFYTQD